MIFQNRVSPFNLRTVTSVKISLCPSKIIILAFLLFFLPILFLFSVRLCLCAQEVTYDSTEVCTYNVAQSTYQHDRTYQLDPALRDCHSRRCCGAADAGVGCQNAVLQVKFPAAWPNTKQNSMFTITMIAQNTSSRGAFRKIALMDAGAPIAKKNR